MQWFWWQMLIRVPLLGLNMAYFIAAMLTDDPSKYTYRMIVSHAVRVREAERESGGRIGGKMSEDTLIQEWWIDPNSCDGPPNYPKFLWSDEGKPAVLSGIALSAADELDGVPDWQRVGRGILFPLGQQLIMPDVNAVRMTFETWTGRPSRLRLWLKKKDSS